MADSDVRLVLVLISAELKMYLSELPIQVFVHEMLPSLGLNFCSDFPSRLQSFNKANHEMALQDQAFKSVPSLSQKWEQCF